MQEKKASKPRVPHTYVILIGLMILISILSYIVPASNYDMMEINGREVVDASTFHYVDSTPVSPLQMLTSVPRGLVESAEIVFFIFILGGSFHIINSTGALEAGIAALSKRLKNAPHLMIPVFVFLFSILGGTIGMSEETIIFVPIGIALARSLGFDAMVGTSIVFLGAAVGFNSGFMNPFTVGVAQSIAELPTFSGIGLRLVVWAVFNVATMAYIIRYANRVRKNPESSIVRKLELREQDLGGQVDTDLVLTTTHKIVLLAFIAALAFIIYGVFEKGFYIIEIAALFLGLGILSGLIARINPSDMAKTFIQGASEIASGALVVGIARSILVVLNDGQILYTIVNGVSQGIAFLPQSIASVGMFIFQLCLNFFIPSGSGQAAATMPIMVPLADILGITRQTAVLAFHLGDGISNSIIPTGGSLLAALSVAKIDYEDWVKFAWPIVGIWVIIGAVFAAVATLIGYGPM
ncbi:MAG: Na+/H+ antiporter NhaC family protein [Tissierellia bacterium]|nr:Na+/H+ antiporter NhaC family protein [Tissierellia bacterium]